jgi:hypothetical protein
MRPTLLRALPALALAALGATLAAPAALRAQNALPDGWQARLDREGGAAAPTFVKMGGGWHATTGPAAVFYDPKSVATGAYTVDATFTQTKAPMHPEAYGLVFGASKLDTPEQTYMYYVVRGDGQYLIKHRAGTAVHTIQDWTASPAIHKADAAGKATNALRVQVGADSVRFFANGTQVQALPKMGTDGIVGLRINHQLDVHVDGPRVTPAAR